MDKNKKISGGSQYSVYGKSHYQRNRQKYIDQAASRRLRNRIYIRQLKEDGQCVDCKIKDWRVLDYDHLPGCEKLFEISTAPERGFSLEKIDKEIAKCVLRCANCHRIITVERASII